MSEYAGRRGVVLRAAQERLGITLNDVWVGYFGVGGNATIAEVGSWLSGVAEPGDHDHDLMAQSFNDRFTDQGLDHPVAYADRLPS